jgi:hypothetical protein
MMLLSSKNGPKCSKMAFFSRKTPEMYLSGQIFFPENCFSRGSRPIDDVWASKGISISNVSAMSVGFGIRDHRMMVVDFPAESVVGNNPQAVVRPGTSDG